MSEFREALCDACGNYDGLIRKCLVCFDYYICAACHSAGAVSKQHSTSHATERIVVPSSCGSSSDAELEFASAASWDGGSMSGRGSGTNGAGEAELDDRLSILGCEHDGVRSTGAGGDGNASAGGSSSGSVGGPGSLRRWMPRRNMCTVALEALREGAKDDLLDDVVATYIMQRKLVEKVHGGSGARRDELDDASMECRAASETASTISRPASEVPAVVTVRKREREEVPSVERKSGTTPRLRELFFREVLLSTIGLVD